MLPKLAIKTTERTITKRSGLETRLAFDCGHMQRVRRLSARHFHAGTPEDAPCGLIGNDPYEIPAYYLKWVDP